MECPKKIPRPTPHGLNLSPGRTGLLSPSNIRLHPKLPCNAGDGIQLRGGLTRVSPGLLPLRTVEAGERIYTVWDCSAIRVTQCSLTNFGEELMGSLRYDHLRIAEVLGLMSRNTLQKKTLYGI